MAESNFPAMNGGDGAFSYAKNSQLQREGSDYVKAMVHEAIIEKLDADISGGVVRLADFGCSVGPNTFSTVQNMIEAVEKKTGPNTGSGAEFEVFFNDKIPNDFNTLFASLPPSRKYYTAVVPGSFHGRLFRRGSRIPPFRCTIFPRCRRGSPTEGHVRGTGAECGGEVEKAYSDQFGRDMEVFLRWRGEEIVKGGLMFLTIPSKGSNSIIIDHIESAILDLVHEGIMKEGEIDGFNLPIYLPSEGDVRKVIEENGCFSIERVELTNPKTRLSARDIAIHFRAILEIFSKFLSKAEEEENSPLLEAALYNSVHLFYVLKRK